MGAHGKIIEPGKTPTTAQVLYGLNELNIGKHFALTPFVDLLGPSGFDGPNIGKHLALS